MVFSVVTTLVWTIVLVALVAGPVAGSVATTIPLRAVSTRVVAPAVRIALVEGSLIVDDKAAVGP
jgi:hypothetical protein